MQYKVGQIAELLGGTVEGNSDQILDSFAKIEEGVPGALSFLANPKYESYIYSTCASAVLVNNDFQPSKPLSVTLIRVENAYASLAKLMQMAEAANKTVERQVSSLAFIDKTAEVASDCMIAPFAYIASNARIGSSCNIHPHVYIGENVVLEDHVTVYPGVVIMKGCVIRKNTILQPGAVVGSDGFGFAPEGESYNKIPQIGTVIVDEDCEIGANTTIDRSTMGATKIGKGTKLDNLIQIAHNVEIGANCVIAAQTGIAGSSKIGNNCMFGGQSGVIGHIVVGNYVKLGAQTGVMRNIPDKETHKGTPNLKAMTFNRLQVFYERLPEMNQKIEQLEKELADLKSKIDR